MFKCVFDFSFRLAKYRGNSQNIEPLNPKQKFGTNKNNNYYIILHFVNEYYFVSASAPKNRFGFDISHLCERL